MILADINPHIRYAREHVSFRCFKTFSRCYDCRLFLFARGCGSVLIENEKYNISNNTVIFMPPGSKYRFDISEPAVAAAHVINFDLGQTHAHIKESLSTATDEDFNPKLITVYERPEEFKAPFIRVSEVGCDLIRLVCEEFLIKRKNYLEYSSALLKTYLMQLMREEVTGGNAGLVGDVIRLIQKRYSECELTNEEIAASFGYHPYYLSRLMKAATGKSLKQYLLYYRIEKAKQLLAELDCEVSEIAWRCGFGTSAYFIKMFKAETGVTPRKYKEKSNLYIV